MSRPQAPDVMNFCHNNKNKYPIPYSVLLGIWCLFSLFEKFMTSGACAKML